jgi:Icc-related predicted phosphoesterase
VDVRILAASDIHSSSQGARVVQDAVLTKEPDLTLVCGDITHFGPLSWSRSFLEGLKGRVLAIPGNCDPVETVTLLEDMGISLHGKKVVVDDCIFVGMGGSSPTPFHTLFEVSEDEIRKTLEPLMQPDAILVTHDAPRGHLDSVPGAGHVGSVAIKEVVEKFSPTLSIFGHLHENPGVQREETVYINLGGGMFGRYALIDTETGEVDLKE